MLGSPVSGSRTWMWQIAAPALADAVVRSQAMKATTIAEIFVEEGRIEHRSQCRCSEERHIAEQDQHTIGIRRTRHRLQHCMPRAELLGLQCPANTGRWKRGANRFRPMAVDNAHIARTQFTGAIEHVRQQGPARQGLQHLRQVGSHAGTLPRGQDDDAQIQGRSSVKYDCG